MRENRLISKKIRQFKPGTTESNHTLRKYPNLLQDEDYNNFPVIVGDVTYYDVNGKNHYCSHLIDLTSREVVGVAVSDRLDTELVLSSLKMAISNRGTLSGYIHHTDSDVRYCSNEYIEILKNAGAAISMCKGNAYENANSESFNKTLKRQEININQYTSKKESSESIFKFIDIYNNYRPHSACGWIPPAEFMKKYKVS